MIKRILPIVLAFASVTSFATILDLFDGWDHLAERSSDIVIARCTSTCDFISGSNQPMIIVNGIIHSGIEVVSVLKGHTKPGVARMSSQYWPYRGQYLLLYAHYLDDPAYQEYSAVESYRVVSLGHDFQTNQLAGMTVEQQIQFILNSRIKNLHGEILEDSNEISRLESGLRQDGKTAATRTNSPSPIQIPWPYTNKGHF